MQRSRAQLLDDCFLHDSERMRHGEALALLKSRLSPIASVQSFNLVGAQGKFAAAPVHATIAVPGHDNAAVDGYAFAHESRAVRKALQITERIAAGDTTAVTLQDGEAARIFTGAPVPAGADTVAMQEDCRVVDGTFVEVPRGLRKGANRRKAGEDMQAGDTIVDSGQLLRPQDIAAAAASGIAQIEVFAPLRVALIGSGSEIVRPGIGKDAGQVYDSNFFLLSGLLASLNVTVIDTGVLADDHAQIRSALSRAAEDCDVIISTGGASRGEEDHIVRCLDELGSRHWWQIAVKPGRPMCFGQIGSTPFFGLPGNPVAAFVCFLLYVRPSLFRLGGGNWPEPARFRVEAGFSVADKKPQRREFWRGWLEQKSGGGLVARKFARDGSGLISGLRAATGLIEISEDVLQVSEGDHLDFIPFSEFGLDGPTLR